MSISAGIRRLMQFFIVLFVALSGSLIYWQVVVAERLVSNPHNSRRCLYENAPIRGRIFDRNGVLLAESRKDPKAVCGYTRYYTEPSLAGLIGYFASEFPPTGLEDKYDDLLSGRAGRTALDNALNSTLHRPPVGRDIYLTIDVRIQKVINEAFDYKNVTEEGRTGQSDKGSIIVAKPDTGEILGMLSRPGYDPNKLAQTLAHNDLSYYNQLEKDKRKPLLFRPTRELYSPGSTYKTVTLMAGLDSGTTTLSSPWSKEQALGPISYEAGTKIDSNNLGFGRYTFYFPITTEYAFENSDNVVFAQIGVNTGLETWLQYNERLYVGKTIPFDLPVVKSSVVHGDGKPLSKNMHAFNSFGQGIDVMTPLQMSLISNTVANDGVLMRPMLVTKVTDEHKNVLTNFAPQRLSDVVSSQTAMQVRQAMFAVTRCGSGILAPELGNTPWGIVGKTGTAQVDDAGIILAHSWLLTQGPYYVDNPAQQPAISVIAMKENGGEAAYSVGPMVAKIYDDIFSKQLVKVQQPNNPVSNVYCPQKKLWQ